ncbi:MAG: hypothetical protein HYT76_06460 [Deltaproteobacteria bacterium]|nr:hypothetical protein [Deltaproteobacteria bacterium]
MNINWIRAALPLLLASTGCALNQWAQKSDEKRPTPPPKGKDLINQETILQEVAPRLSEPQKALVAATMHELSQTACQSGNRPDCLTSEEGLQNWNRLIREVPEAGIPLFLARLARPQNGEKESLQAVLLHNHEEIYQYAILYDRIPLSAHAFFDSAMAISNFYKDSEKDKSLFISAARHWGQRKECFTTYDMGEVAMMIGSRRYIAYFVSQGLEGGGCSPTETIAILSNYDFSGKPHEYNLLTAAIKNRDQWPDSATFRVNIMRGVLYAGIYTSEARAGVTKILDDSGENLDSLDPQQVGFEVSTGLFAFAWLFGSLPEEEKKTFLESMITQKPLFGLAFLEMAKPFLGTLSAPVQERFEADKNRLETTDTDGKRVAIRSVATRFVRDMQNLRQLLQRGP